MTTEELTNSVNAYLATNKALGTTTKSSAVDAIESNKTESLSKWFAKGKEEISTSLKLKKRENSTDAISAILNNSDANNAEQAKELNNVIRKTTSMQFAQMFKDMYLSETNSDAEWRIGLVSEENIEKDFMDTTMNLRYRIPYDLSTSNFSETEDEYYINYLFPPFNNSIFGTTSGSTFTPTRTWNSTYQRWEKSSTTNSAEIPFKSETLESDSKIRIPTHRTAAYKALNDNISFIQKIFENVTGIVSTYLTDWDISLYIQENIATQLNDDTAAAVTCLLHRIMEDNPSGYNSDKAYAYGLLPAAVSKYSIDDVGPNLSPLDPTAYPLSIYWTPYKIVNRGDGLGEFYDLALKGFNADADLLERLGFEGTSFSSMSTREQIRYYDYLQAAYTGWKNWGEYKNNGLLYNYQALYSTEKEDMTPIDMLYLAEKKHLNKTWEEQIPAVIRTLYKMYPDLGEYAKLWTETSHSTVKAKVGMKSGEHKCWTTSYYFLSPTTNSGKCICRVKYTRYGIYAVYDADGNNFAKVVNLNAEEKEELTSLLGGYDGFDYIWSWFKIAQMRDKFVASDKNSNGITPPIDKKKYSYLFAKEEKVTSSSSSNSNDEPKGTAQQKANHAGISQWNPFLYGGPHGRSLSPKTLQGYFEVDNAVLKSIPRSNGILSIDNLVASKMNDIEGTDIFYSTADSGDQYYEDGQDNQPVKSEHNPYRTPQKNLAILKNGLVESRTDIKSVEETITTYFRVNKTWTIVKIFNAIGNWFRRLFGVQEKKVYDYHTIYTHWGTKNNKIDYASLSSVKSGPFETQTGIYVSVSKGAEACTKANRGASKNYITDDTIPYFEEGAWLWATYFRYNTDDDYYYIDSSKSTFRKTVVGVSTAKNYGQGSGSVYNSKYGTGSGTKEYKGECYQLIHVQNAPYLKGTYKDAYLKEEEVASYFGEMEKKWAMEEIHIFECGKYDVSAIANIYKMASNIFQPSFLKSLLVFSSASTRISYRVQFESDADQENFKNAIGANSEDYDFNEWADCFFFVGGSTTSAPLMIDQLPVRWSNVPYTVTRTKPEYKCNKPTGNMIEYDEVIDEPYIEVDINCEYDYNKTKPKINLSGYKADYKKVSLARKLNAPLSNYEPGENAQLTKFPISPLEANLISVDENHKPQYADTSDNSKAAEEATDPIELEVSFKTYGYGYLMYMPGLDPDKDDTKLNLTKFSEELRTKGSSVVEKAYKKLLCDLPVYKQMSAPVSSHEQTGTSTSEDADGNIVETPIYTDYKTYTYQKVNKADVENALNTAVANKDSTGFITKKDDIWKYASEVSEKVLATASDPFADKVNSKLFNETDDTTNINKWAAGWKDTWTDNYKLAKDCPLGDLFDKEDPPKEDDDIFGKSWYPYIPFYNQTESDGKTVYTEISNARRIRQFLKQALTTLTLHKNDGNVYLADMNEPIINNYSTIQYQKAWFELASIFFKIVDGEAINDIKTYQVDTKILNAKEGEILYRHFINDVMLDESFRTDLVADFNIFRETLDNFKTKNILNALDCSWSDIVDNYIELYKTKEFTTYEGLDRITKKLNCYLNILYEYRKFFIYKRCNKTDGTLWSLRALESAAPLIDEITTTGGGNNTSKDEATASAENIYQYNVWQTELNNSNVDKVNAIINNGPSLSPDKFKKLFFEVQYEEDPEIIKNFVTSYNGKVSTEAAFTDFRSSMDDLALAEEYDSLLSQAGGFDTVNELISTAKATFDALSGETVTDLLDYLAGKQDVYNTTQTNLNLVNQYSNAVTDAGGGLKNESVEKVIGDVFILEHPDLNSYSAEKQELYAKSERELALANKYKSTLDEAEGNADADSVKGALIEIGIQDPPNIENIGTYIDEKQIAVNNAKDMLDKAIEYKELLEAENPNEETISNKRDELGLIENPADINAFVNEKQTVADTANYNLAKANECKAIFDDIDDYIAKKQETYEAAKNVKELTDNFMAAYNAAEGNIADPTVHSALVSLSTADAPNPEACLEKQQSIVTKAKDDLDKYTAAIDEAGGKDLLSKLQELAIKLEGTLLNLPSPSSSIEAKQNAFVSYKTALINSIDAEENVTAPALAYCFYNGKWIKLPHNNEYWIRSKDYDKAYETAAKQLAFNEEAELAKYIDSGYVTDDGKVEQKLQSIVWGSIANMAGTDVITDSTLIEKWGISDSAIPIYWDNGGESTGKARIIFNADSVLNSNVESVSSSLLNRYSPKDVFCSMTERIDFWSVLLGDNNMPLARLYKDAPYIITKDRGEISELTKDDLEIIAALGPFAYDWYPITKTQESAVLNVLTDYASQQGASV